MEPDKRPAWTVVILAAAAVALLAGHFAFERDAAPAPETARPARTETKESLAAARASGAERDAALRDAFREKHRPSLSDDAAEHKEKVLGSALSRLGNNPVEVADGDLARVPAGLKELKSDADVDAFIKAGGHYSGPQISDEEKAIRAAQAANAKNGTEKHR